MLSKLGSAIGNLFSPLKVKEIGGGAQSNKLNNVSDQNQKQSRQHQKQSDSEPKSDPEPKLSQTNTPTSAAVEPVLRISPGRSEQPSTDAIEKVKQDELIRKNQDIGLSGVWVEMKDKLSADSQPRSLQANDAYEAGLKKKRSLLKNSKGGMVDKKAA